MAILRAFGRIGRVLVMLGVGVAAFGLATSGEARLVWLVIGFVTATTGMTFALVGTRLRGIAHLDDRLRVMGMVGTAEVVSVRGAGLRVNGQLVVDVELAVEVDGPDPYTTTIRQLVPGFWGPLHPGMVVGVVVARDDPSHLAIDWDAEVAPRSPSADTVEEGHPNPIRDVDGLLRVGRRAKAIIISMRDAGDMSELGLVEVGSLGDDDRLFIVDMEIQLAGLESYEVRVAHPVPERLVGRVGPRTKVDVAIDREDDQAVAIDWSSVSR